MKYLDNRIVHCFRADPGMLGNHIGNSGKIMQRTTWDNGLTWTPAEDIYDDDFDDRNVHGYSVYDDTMVVAFRRYDAITSQTVDSRIIISGDGGESWTEPVENNTLIDNSILYSSCYVPDSGYLIACYKMYYVDIRYSPDGRLGSEILYKWDYRSDQEFQISEPYFTYIGGGRIAGLFRVTNQSYMLVLSEDYGRTWSEPMPTNICNNMNSVAPLIFYNENHDDVWVIASDRRGGSGFVLGSDSSEVWIYRNKGSLMFDNPGSFELYHKFARPYSNLLNFYGYPIYIETERDHYLVVFTDCYKNAYFLEAADFFQFEIFYQDYTDAPALVAHTENQVTCYPNPAESHINFNVNGAKGKDLTIFDIELKSVASYSLNGEESFQCDISGLPKGIYYYRTNDTKLFGKFMKL